MVFGLGHHHREDEAAYNAMYGDNIDYEEHDGNKLHEMLAGAAAFAAMRSYENRRAAEGINDHALARELLAAVAGAEVDKLAETKGMDWADRERAKRRAIEKANSMYDSQYANQDDAGGLGGSGYQAGGVMGDAGYGAAYEGREGMAPGYGAYDQQAAGFQGGGGYEMQGGGYQQGREGYREGGYGGGF